MTDGKAVQEDLLATATDPEILTCPKCGVSFPATHETRGPGPAKAKFAAHVNKCRGVPAEAHPDTPEPENPANVSGPAGIASPEPSGGLDSATCVACTMVVAGEPIPATEDGKCLECGRDLTAPATLEEAAKACAHVEITTITELCKISLTDAEYKDLSIKMGQVCAEISQAQDDLTALKSRYKSRIDAGEAKRSEIADIMRVGWEERPIECQLIKDYGSNTISKVRPDTGEQIGYRAMSQEERQRGLQFMEAAGQEAGEEQ